MAEFLWTFAVQEVLKKVVKLAAAQIGVAWGLDKELSKLRKWLLKAETILRDINRKKLCHDSVRLWVEDLQHVVYQADDLLDELVYEDLRRKVEMEKLNKVRNFFSPSNNPFLFRSKMAKEMKAISETLYKHYCEASVLGLIGEESTETDNRNNVLKQIRETTSILNFEVVGREDEVSNIVKLVIDSSNEHRMSILPIVGMGGVGKTTLAKMVFNHELIQEHFNKTIWVCVSEPFIIVNILEGIFQGLTNTSSGLNYKETLLHRLQKEMQGKKYFLVLDDVWNEEVGLWGELRDCLNEIVGKSGDSIIVTTRSTEVATIMETVPSHHLRKLLDDECWSLFKKSANANGLLMNPELENLRKVVVKKIDGIPLVAKVLGGAAKFEGNYERWVTIVESMVRNISNDDKDFVLSILKLSVDSLPLLSLKQCFAFCSNFPKDYEFDKENLIQMWIAQGFIQIQGDHVMLEENIGEDFFNFLLSRSLFQDVVKNKYGRITHFKMHDLIHDVACVISNQKLELDPYDRNEKGVRKLRTLVTNNEAIIHNMLEDCAYLRVLAINLNCIEKLSESIGMLKHLRYLDIGESRMWRQLPESITMLYNLQTLKLGTRVNLPKNLRKLVQLRHLDFYTYTIQMPLHMSQLIHLQTLPRYIVSSEQGCKIEELGPLNNLKGSLQLLNLERVKSKEEGIAAKLIEKNNLCELTLSWNICYDKEDSNRNDLEVLEGLQPHKNLQSLSILHFAGHVLPNAVFVENLVAIVVHECRKCEMIPMLGQLPHLEELEISYMDSVRSIGSEFYGTNSNSREQIFFPKLRKLSFSRMENLEQWEEVSNGIAFPHLETLSMFYCSKLTSVPDHEFVSLQTLITEGCEELTKLPSKLECCSSIQISDCPNLRLNVHNMCNLRKIEIIACMQEYDFSSLMHQSSVTHLSLTDSFGTATGLPQQLQHLTSLKALTIQSFNCIEALPEWLEKLASLETLDVFYCENLQRLPSQQAMLRLTKLKHLHVRGCPLLLIGEGDLGRAKLSNLPISIDAIDWDNVLSN